MKSNLEAKNDSQVGIDLIKKYGTKSQAIRELNAQGKTRKEIATILNIRYQHVRNVLITPIKQPRIITK